MNSSEPIALSTSSLHAPLRLLYALLARRFRGAAIVPLLVKVLLSVLLSQESRLSADADCIARTCWVDSRNANRERELPIS